MQKETVKEPEDVEIDEQELDLADYPLDDILIRTSQFTIRQVIEEIDEDLISFDDTGLFHFPHPFGHCRGGQPHNPPQGTERNSCIFKELQNNIFANAVQQLFNFKVHGKFSFI